MTTIIPFLLAAALCAIVALLFWRLRRASGGIRPVPGLASAWNTVRDNALGLVPMTPAMLIENMTDGVLVLDTQNRIIAINPAMERLARIAPGSIGKPVGQVCDLLRVDAAQAETQTETICDKETSHNLESRSVPLRDHGNRVTGHLIVFHDVTERTQMQAALHDLHASLECSLAEREAALSRLKDEIAERQRVEETLRRMEETLAARVADQSRSLSALYELILFAGQPLTVQQIQEQALATIMTVMSGSAGCIHQWDERSHTLRLFVHRGLDADAQAQIETLPADWMMSDKIPRMLTALQVDPAVPESIRLPGFQAYLGAPVYLLGRPIGSLELFWSQARSFSVEEIALFSTMADQLGIIVENVRLRERGEAAAALKERRKLARDLHDSVTQSLHSLVLSAETASYRLSRGKLDRLEMSLGHLAESARQALKEMRLLVFEMRLVPLAQVNIVEALELRLDAVEKRAGVEAKFMVENLAELPRAWEDEFYCIAMEALNNSLKHARASSVNVRLSGDHRGFELQVEDNGRGIDPHASRPGGIGLHTMAERAERIGGHFSIISTPGAGTRVCVRVERP